MFKSLFHILIFATKPLKRQRILGLEDYVDETKRFITQEQCQLPCTTSTPRVNTSEVYHSQENTCVEN